MKLVIPPVALIKKRSSLCLFMVGTPSLAHPIIKLAYIAKARAPSMIEIVLEESFIEDIALQIEFDTVSTPNSAHKLPFENSDFLFVFELCIACELFGVLNFLSRGEIVMLIDVLQLDLRLILIELDEFDGSKSSPPGIGDLQRFRQIVLAQDVYLLISLLRLPHTTPSYIYQ